MTQHYYGSKIITAWEQEKDGQPGYAVRYADGYTSWSPKAVFEEAYLSIGHVGALPEDLQQLRGQIVATRDRAAALRGQIHDRSAIDPRTADLIQMEITALELLLTAQEERFDASVVVYALDDTGVPSFKLLEPLSQGAGFNNAGLQDNS